MKPFVWEGFRGRLMARSMGNQCSLLVRDRWLRHHLLLRHSRRLREERFTMPCQCSLSKGVYNLRLNIHWTNDTLLFLRLEMSLHIFRSCYFFLLLLQNKEREIVQFTGYLKFWQQYASQIQIRNKHERLIPQRKVERHRATMAMKGREGEWLEPEGS